MLIPVILLGFLSLKYGEIFLTGGIKIVLIRLLNFKQPKINS